MNTIGGPAPSDSWTLTRPKGPAKSKVLVMKVSCLEQTRSSLDYLRPFLNCAAPFPSGGDSCIAPHKSACRFPGERCRVPVTFVPNAGRLTARRPRTSKA